MQHDACDRRYTATSVTAPRSLARAIIFAAPQTAKAQIFEMQLELAEKSRALSHFEEKGETPSPVKPRARSPAPPPAAAAAAPASPAPSALDAADAAEAAAAAAEAAIASEETIRALRFQIGELQVMTRRRRTARWIYIIAPCTPAERRRHARWCLRGSCTPAERALDTIAPCTTAERRHARCVCRRGCMERWIQTPCVHTPG